MADNYWHMTDDGNQIGIDENLETEYRTNDIDSFDYTVFVYKDRIYRLSNDLTDKRNAELYRDFLIKIFKAYPQIKEKYFDRVLDPSQAAIYLNNLPYLIVGSGYEDGSLFLNSNSYFDYNQSGELKKIIDSGLFNVIYLDSKMIYNANKQKENLPNVSKLYHGTSLGYALRIIQKGLRPSPSNTTFNGIKHNDTVFLSTQFEEARKYAIRASKLGKLNGDFNEPVVLEFDINHLDSNKIVFDYDVHNMFTSRNDSIYKNITSQLSSKYNGTNENPSIKDTANPLKFGKIGYRGIVMPSAISGINLINQRKKFNDLNSFVSFVYKYFSIGNETSTNEGYESALNRKESTLNEAYYLQGWQRKIIESLPDKVVLYHSTKPEGMEYILTDREFKHGLGDEGDSNNIWFSLNSQNNFGSCLFGILVPKSDFENVTFRLMNDEHVCYSDFEDLPLDKYPYKILRYKGYKIQDLVNNANGDYDKLVDILYVLYDKEDDYIMIQNLMEEFLNGKYTDNKMINEAKADRLILENREGKNINLARKYLLSNGYSLDDAKEILDTVRDEVPNSRIAQSKFLLGVTRMYMSGDLRDYSMVSMLNKTLIYIGSDAHVNEYNNDLNGENSQTLIQRFAKNIEADLNADKESVSNQSYQANSEYRIVPIRSFDEATQYGDYTEWCVTHYEEMFDAYTHNGLGRFYFCLRNGFENEPREVGENTPLDNYGLSMIAISVNEDGSLNTCTCRWNHGDDELGVRANDNIMNTQEISQLLGVNFYDTFLPITNEEKMEFIRKKEENYYYTLNYLNENGGIDVFPMHDYLSDNSEIVSLDEYDNSVEEYAIITKNSKNEFDYISFNENERITFFKYYGILGNGMLALVDNDGKSRIVEIDSFKILYNLPDNTLIGGLNNKFRTDGIPKELVKMFTDNENISKFRIYNLSNGNISDFELSNRYNTHVRQAYNMPNVLMIDDVTNKARFYYDYTQNKVVDIQEKLFSIKTINSDYGIATDENYNCNLYSFKNKQIVFDIWFDELSEIEENDKLLLCKFLDGTYNLINLSNLEGGFMLSKNFKRYGYRAFNDYDEDYNVMKLYMEYEDGTIIILNLNTLKFYYQKNDGKNDMDDVRPMRKRKSARKPKMGESIANNGKTIYINESQAKRLILENREGKNINLARKYAQSKGYDKEQAQKLIDNIRTDIPNSRIAQCKFLLGVTRMYLNGELSDQPSIAKLNKTLYYIGSDTHVNEYDNNLNNENAQALIQRFAKNVEADLNADKESVSSQQYQVNNDYQIVPIHSFEESSEYGDYTTWCVTHQEEMYDSYTHNGLGKFYFCLRNGFENEPEEAGENAPLDSYGLSMIAVSVNEDGSLNTCTCRWNHSMGGNDNIMNTQEISQLLGVNFYQTFLPITEEEKQAAIEKTNEKYYSALEEFERTGSFDHFSYYDIVNNNVYVVSMDEVGDVAVLIDDNDGAFFFPYNEDKSIKFFKDFMIIKNHYLSLIETNGTSYVLDVVNLNKIMDLPNNSKVTQLSYLLPTNFPPQIVRLVDENRKTFRILNLSNKAISDFELPNRDVSISEVSQPNTIKIQLVSYDGVYNRTNILKSFYYDYMRNEVVNVTENTYEVATNKRIFYYERKYDIVVNENGKYNLFVKEKQRLAFDIWFYDIYQLDSNRDLLMVKVTERECNIINLLDSPYEFMFPNNFKSYQIMVNYNKQDEMIIINMDNTIGKLDLDSLHYEQYSNPNNNVANESKLYKENIELEVTPDEVDTSTVDKKDTLNTKLWDANKTLNPKVRLRLLDIADEFWFGLNLDWVEPMDIIITGSICNYNWNDYSDIDLHILIDYNDIDENKELVKSFCDSVKNEWNEQHINLSIYGFPIEVYIQDINGPHDSNGIYSLEKNKWIKEPSPNNIKPIDGRADMIRNKAAMLMTIADNLEDHVMLHRDNKVELSNISKYINAYILKIKKMRKKALDSNGEMSDGNLIYKLMRQKGYIDKVYKLKYMVFDYLNSLN